MQDLSERLSGLSPAKRALLLKQLQKQNGIEKPLRPRTEQYRERAPLSFAQQRLWFLDQLDPGQSVYHLPAAFAVYGRIDMAAVHDAVNEIVRRHETLRTRFEDIDGEPVQRIAPTADARVGEVDLSGFPEDELPAAWDRAVINESSRPFNLAEDLPFRVKVVHLTAELHQVIFVLHHIVSDAWSMDNLKYEFYALYDAFRQGLPSPVPPLTIQYADFAIWQREHLQGEMLHEEVAFWRERLAGAPALLELPTDFARPPIQGFAGRTHVVNLEAQPLDLVRELSRREGVTLFMTVLAAYHILLHRYSGQDDVVVGATVSNRQQYETEPLIGFFVNTLPMRVDLSGNPTVRDILAQIRNVVLEAYAHQDLPFDSLVDHLKVPRTLSHTPVFQVVLTNITRNLPAAEVTNELPIVSADGPEEAVGQVKLQPEAFAASMSPGVDLPHNSTAKFDLSLAVDEMPDMVKCVFEYRTDLFRPETIEVMADRYIRLLVLMAVHPELGIDQIPLIGVEDIPHLQRLHRPQEHYPKDSTLVDFFEQRVQKAPDLVAVSNGQRQLSYGELNERANQFAHYVMTLGLQPGALVGVSLQSIVDMVCAVLGIAKAGMTCIPLSAGSTAQEMRDLVSGATLDVLLVRHDGLELLPVASERIVQLDPADLCAFSAEKPDAIVTPDTVVHVVSDADCEGPTYGVRLSHHNLVRLMRTMTVECGFTAEDVWSLTHPLSTDLGVWELWGALLSGGKLAVMPGTVATVPEALRKRLTSEQVTILTQTPSEFQSFIEIADGKTSRLRLIIVRGEPPEQSVHESWFQRREEDCQIILLYGSPETSICAAYQRLSFADVQGTFMRTPGQPLPDISLYVLDRFQQLCPVGMSGELYVRGAGLAPGYLNRPELEEKRFPHIGSDTDQPARLYRTGHRVRLTSDGNVEFLGSAIQQAGEFPDALTSGSETRASEAVVADFEIEAPELPLSKAEQFQLHAWNATEQDYPDGTVLETIARQVQRSPHAVALVYEDASLSYAELDAQSNQLAHHLRSLGVGTGSLVGVAMERSLQLPLALLAILKAGAAYVPLDPSYPPDRLAFMLTDAQVSVLLTQEHLLASLPPTEAIILSLDRDWSLLTEQPTTPPPVTVSPTDLAYVIYTSGSTGVPKGCLNLHAGLANRLQWMQETYALDATDAVLQKTPYSFDVSVWEFFWPFMTGARLVVARPGGHQDPGYLVSLIREGGITTLHFVPSMLALFLEEPGLETLVSLRRVICSGEALPGSLQQRFFARLACELHNLYGPTEAAIDVSFHACSPHDPRPSVPIGRPVANTQLWVLDGQGGLVPIGVPGELYIGGVQVGAGYLHRPSLTAQRFVPDPLGAPGSRLYRTGDLVRLLPEGELEFLGRLDQQVKLRGLRIELGEIEARLEAHPQIKDALVLVQGEGEATRLVAYVVPQGEAPAIPDLQSHLAQTLPEYMIPQSYVTLDAFPLSPNGKLDRKALPAPELAPASQTGYVPPTTPLEEQLVGIWQEVLGAERVGIHDNFFALGGDSILTIRVVSKARRLGLTLTPKQFFRHQTVAQLAQVAVREEAESAAEVLPGPVPLTPIQHWFFAQEQPLPHHWNQAMLLTVPEEVDITLLERAIQAVVAHHPVFRLAFSRTESGWQQEILPVEALLPVQLATIDLTQVPAEERAETLEAEAGALQGSMKLDTPPLLRAALVQHAPAQPPLLLLAIHHLLVDGVSWRILLEELELAYAQLEQGRSVSLPAEGLAFPHWAQRLSAVVQEESFGAEIAFWQEQSQQPLLPLPLDYPEGENTVASTRRVVAALSEEDTSTLLRTLPVVYRAGLDEVLLTALSAALTSWTGHETLRVDLEGHGREEVVPGDLSGTVGWFTALSPVSLTVPHDVSLQERFLAVKRRLQQVRPHGISYGLVRYLTDTPLPSQPAPLLFNYLGQFGEGQGGGFHPSGGPTGPVSALTNHRPYPLEVMASIQAGQLVLSWLYSDALHEERTMQAVVDEVMGHLQDLAAHVRSPQAGGLTPEDVPLAGISPEELDTLLAALAQQEGVSVGQAAQDIEELYPLTPLQEGLFFHSLVDPHSGVYDNQLAIQLDGHLDAAAFRYAWEQLLARYAILRTSVHWEHLSHPLQVVHRQVALPFTQLDWTQVPAEQVDGALADFLAQDRTGGFRFSQAPLFRLTLIDLPGDRQVLVWTNHHLLLDGWSKARVFVEMGQLYAAHLQQHSLVLPPPRPYREYIAWLQQQDREGARTFWQEYLQGFTAPTPLMVDTLPSSATGSGQALHMLSPETSQALREMARGNQLTLNTLIQGAWALLLSRYSGEQDVVFGQTVSGRSGEMADIEGMVGLLINTLPVRVRLSLDQQLLPWLRAIQAQQGQATQYEYSSLVDIQGWSQVPRGTPLFESLLVFENYLVDATTASSGSTTTEAHVTATSFDERTNYPLTLMVLPGPAIRLQVMYQPGRFDAAVIEHVLSHLTTVLEGMVATPEARIEELRLLTEAEEQRQEDWNATEAEIPPVTVDTLVHQQAHRTPTAPALRCGEVTLSYAEVEARANQLAHHLRTLGVGPEVLVGLYLDRSIEMVVAMLAVWKAGGAYVPLDPSYPSDRLAFMVADSGASLLVTESSLLSTAPGGAAQVLCLDTDVATWSQLPTTLPDAGSLPSNRAYVLYTSGSTGRPKGVMIPHGAVVNFLCSMQGVTGITPDDGLLAVTSLSFDIAVLELLLPLITGARVEVVSREVTADGPRLRAALEGEGITIMQATPATWTMLRDAGWTGSPALTILCGGEALPPQLAAFLAGAGKRLLNVYGPTETTIWSSAATLAPATQRITIGFPLANTQLWVVDDWGHRVPVGVPGELYIGGAGVARGYLGRPGLTASRFVPDPFGPPGSRLYRTGDLVRRLPDGSLDYLGRLDHQVKLRGFRIELGEIEARLGDHPAIKGAVVLLQGEGDHQQLVAYVVPAGEVPAFEEVRAHLAQTLPGYMLPTQLIPLDAFPLTPNGKLDRNALPAPGPTLATEAGYIPPTTPTEEQLVGIWQEVLGMERIGIHDNFFALGGHSLLVTRVVSRIRTVFQIELPLAELFAAPTIAGLAERVLAAQREDQGVVIPPLVPMPHDDLVPLSFAQERLWLLEQLAPGNAAYHLSGAVRLSGHLDIDALDAAVQTIVQRHEILRTTIVMGNEGPMQVITPHLEIPLPVVDLTVVPAEEREELVRQALSAAALQPFDLEHGPMLRLALLQVGETEHILFLVMHHIAADGWSLSILTQELATLYTAYHQQQPSHLPDLPIQYADFTLWQRSWLKDEVLEGQLAYWREQLAGLDPLDLPTDYPRPPVQTFHGASLPLYVGSDLVDRLTVLAQEQGGTLYMILVAALQLLLSRYSGRTDVAIGAPIANRQHAELESLIGCFVNTLVLRTDLSGNPSVTALLERVSQTTLGAYAHQDLPFEMLVASLQPERDLARTPFFQVLLAFQNFPETSLQLDELTLSSQPYDLQTTQFDLAFYLTNTPVGLIGNVTYNTDLFSADTVHRLGQHLGTLLEGMVAQPETGIAELPLLTQAEEQELATWNGSDETIDFVSLDSMIQEQVARTPTAPALCVDQVILTYAELDARVQRIAQHVQRHGVGPDCRVGLYVERSVEMAVGILGILRAGAAYVPLDPAYPADRVSFMMDDAGIILLLTHSSLQEQLPSFTGPILFLDDDQAQDEAPSVEASEPFLPATVAPKSLAYVIYTSGSTGRPKGVGITQANVSAFIQWARSSFTAEQVQGVLFATSMCFDLSVFEFFLPLTSGGMVILAQDALALPALPARERVTLMNTVPSVLSALLAMGDLPSSLRTVNVAGEPLPRELAQRVYAYSQVDALYNLYAPSETTTYSTVQLVDRESERSPGIGRPITGTQVHILDEAMRLVPMGVPGELYIGGAGVARGYLGRPGLTASRFVPDPFGPPGSRLYRTGDLVRRLPDGSLDYLGRLDHQVKLRGFRIELGEIEARLGDHPAIKEAVVLLQGEGDHQQLVAYVVPAGEVPAFEEVRAHLAQTLPGYMLPTQLIPLDAFPLTPNGKLDRNALPSPEGVTMPVREYVPPSSSMERAIAAIWQELLGVEQVGLNDNFFELGGHSLQAALLSKRLEPVLGQPVPVIDIYRLPTIRLLVESLAAGEEQMSFSTVQDRAARRRQQQRERKPRQEGERTEQ